MSPGDNRDNNIDRSIQTFKNHFIAGLCIVGADFHLQLLDRILQQATIILNLLIKSKLHPYLLAHAHLYGESKYNQTPLELPGTTLVVHNRPGGRDSWTPHG